MTIRYAGFWRRLCAGAVDTAFLIGILSLTLWAFHYLETDQDTFFRTAAWGLLFFVIISWLYHALLLCSKYQATLGMRLFRMVIYSYDGQRICFGQASIRHWAAFIFFLGGGGIIYLWIVFSPRKQGLHDLAAHTLVVVSTAPSAAIEATLWSTGLAPQFFWKN